ncbi:MAG TPA: hypothetical protein VFY34_02615 [Pyrinomonadaceae bacterium]|nr:hypothetical protein [Pyrinomonadaceae bacterium]
MKASRVHFGLALALLCVCNIEMPAQNADSSKAGDEKLVYADFQQLENGRLVSSRGGRTQLNRWAQNMGAAPKMRGLENVEPPTPAPARVTDQDTAAAFEYEMRLPNEWAGVNLEIFGQPEKDGKPVADDISGYKYISMRLFGKGPQSVRVELISRGQGINLESGYPEMTFRLSPGFNTYKFKLDSFRQPEWGTPLDIKRDILKKLTSVTIGVFCNKCRMESGTVVVDNIVFEK